MIYTLVGNKDYVLEEIDKIVGDSSNIISYDLEECSIKDAIIDLDTVSLFGKKIVKVFGLDKIDDSDFLIKYLDNALDNVLILVSYKELDNRKKLTKMLKEKTKYKEIFSYDFNSYVKERLEGFKMDFMTINLLVSYCDGDIKRLLNELEKLKLYKFNEKVITSDDVNKLVRKGYDSTIFNLIDEINNSNKEKVFNIYRELLMENETEEKILYTIANHYRLLYKIKIKSMSMSDSEMIKIYKLHPYRLTKLKEQCRLVSREKILSMLKGLSDVDISVKSGKTDISTGMFLFLEKL
mgnify:FL=1